MNYEKAIDEQATSFDVEQKNRVISDALSIYYGEGDGTEDNVSDEVIIEIVSLLESAYDLNPTLAMSASSADFIEYAKHYDVLKKRLTGLEQLIDEELVPLKHEFDASGTINSERAARIGCKIESFMKVAVKTNLRRNALCWFVPEVTEERGVDILRLGQDIVAEYYMAEYEYYAFILELEAVEGSEESSRCTEYFNSAILVDNDGSGLPTWLVAQERYRQYLERAVGTNDKEPDVDYFHEDYENFLALTDTCDRQVTLIKSIQASGMYYDNCNIMAKR